MLYPWRKGREGGRKEGTQWEIQGWRKTFLGDKSIGRIP